MTKNPISVPIDFTIEETAEVLLRHKINGVPVMEQNGRLAGVITQTDLFRVIISLTGVGKRGIQFGFKLEDRSGSIKDIADVIRAYRGKMVSILTSYDGAPEGYRWAYIRIYDIDRTKIESLKEDLRKKAPLLYMVDHREDRREIY
jgi:acetoin utilization protein AcuB